MRYFSAIQDPKDLENKYVEYTCKVRYTSTLLKYDIPVQQNGGFILLFDRTSLYSIFSI